MSGITATGFEIKTVQDLLDDINAGLKAAFGSDFDTSADGPAGQVAGVFAGSLAEAWQLAQAVYGAQYPSSANDASLDNVTEITGSIRFAATKSTATVTCTGDLGTILLIGRVISHVTTEDRFESLADATLIAVTAWVGSTAYVIGDQVTNSGNIYVCTVAGTSAGAGGPSGTGQAIVDGTVTWAFVGTGTAAVDVTFRAEQFGPIAAPAGSLTTIETPVAGWNGARNALDVELGTDLETDPAFRLRRAEELALSGTSTVDAIRSDLLGVDNVLEVFVYENVSEFIDADGRPPHSIECVVRTTTGDTPDAIIDQAVADQIFTSKPAGIETFGFGSAPQKVTNTVTDDQGTSHTINWTRVEDIEIFIEIDVTTDSELYPLDGDAQVKAALVTQGDTLTAGEDVIAEKNKCEAFDVTGVLDIVDYNIGTSAPPTLGDNIPITDRQVADFDTSRITVV